MGDRVDFDEFVAARSVPLLRAAWMLTGDWQLAEDLLQTVLTKCFLRWRRIGGGEEAYVRRALFTTYVTWWRRRWSGEYPANAVDEAPSSDDSYADVDVRRALVAALAKLPRRQRAVVVLRYYCDSSVVETAQIMGCSVGTVKSQAAKALATLRSSDLAEAINEGTTS